MSAAKDANRFSPVFSGIIQNHHLDNIDVSSQMNPSTVYNYSETLESQKKGSDCCGTVEEHLGRQGQRLSSSFVTAVPSMENTYNSFSQQNSQATAFGRMPEGGKLNDSFPDTHGISQVYPFQLPTTTVYNMPPTYATAENPLTQRQQAFYQQNSQLYTQQVPHYAPLGVFGTAAPSADGHNLLQLTHTCTCGPSCQCIFCIAHPFNATTRDRVQTLADMLLADNEQTPQSPLQSSYPLAFHNPNETGVSVSTATPIHVDNLLQPSDPQRKGEIPQRQSSENYFQAPQSSISADYLAMQYEFGPPEFHECTDATGSCRCGDDCTCIGCLTHSGHDRKNPPS